MKFFGLTIATSLILASHAHAAVFSADSATATSEFSASYDAGNTIDGSGLSSAGNPGATHADYVANNHWTTANGDTVGESITWAFSAHAGVDLGGLYIWNHRSTPSGSGGVGANDSYEPVLFDLLVSDTGGTALAQFTNQVIGADTNTSQSYSLSSILTGVGSVTFTVKATQNGNISPYTGLAEVLFDDGTIDDGALLGAAPVPLPAGLPLLLAGMGGLALLRRKQR